MLHTPDAEIFVHFAPRWAVFKLRSLFYGKVYRMPHATYPPRPKFASVFYDEPFSSYGPILGKVHRMTPNDLDMFKVKNTNMHGACTPGAQSFVCFTLRRSVFELPPNFGKSAPNDPNVLDMLKVKNTNIHTTYTPEAQIFFRFALPWAVFELRPFFRKSAPNGPQMVTFSCKRDT